MARDKQQATRREQASHPPSNHKPEGATRQQPERGRSDIFQSQTSHSNHRTRTERQILWENDLYERQSI